MTVSHDQEVCPSRVFFVARDGRSIILQNEVHMHLAVTDTNWSPRLSSLTVAARGTVSTGCVRRLRI